MASGAAEVVGVEPDPVADVQVADVLALEDPRAAIVESDVDAVADDGRLVVAFDIVARDRAAGAPTPVIAARPSTVAELVADDGARGRRR